MKHDIYGTIAVGIIALAVVAVVSFQIVNGALSGGYGAYPASVAQR